MSRSGDIARMESILKYIDDIKNICANHGSVTATMLDMEGRYAVLMCIYQIGELLGKLSTEEFTSRLPIREATGMRNILAHNYEGIETKIAVMTIDRDIPALRMVLLELLKDHSQIT
jgi:uncharacterized protein with HEPN domain